MKKINLKKKINKKILEYYKSYYLKELGLPDWKQRADNRLLEEKTFSSKIFDEILSKIQFNFKNKKTLVNGCGTGGELIYALSVLNADAYGIEPNEKALEICNMKAQLFGIDKERVINAVAENLPFEDNTFDFIFCYTVIEHVQNVEMAIEEMIRVTKKNGYIYINAPDYRQFTERHYKVHLPMFLPKWINKIFLRLQGRPTDFLDSLQLVNKKQLEKIFDKNNVSSKFYFKNAKFNWRLIINSPLHICYYLTSKLFKISDMQEWIIKKN